MTRVAQDLAAVMNLRQKRQSSKSVTVISWVNLPLVLVGHGPFVLEQEDWLWKSAHSKCHKKDRPHWPFANAPR
jgi:hypothetical protein